VALHTVEFGPLDAPLVVLVHGTMDRAGGMARAARILADRHRVLVYDRRGYGRSKPHAGPYDMTTQVEDLLTVMDGRPAVVVGHSFGGNVALAAAVSAPELVRAVAVYETPLSWMPWWPTHSGGSKSMSTSEDPQQAAEDFMRRMVGDDVWAKLPAKARADRRAEGPALVGELAALVAVAPYDPAMVRVPAVVAHGSLGSDHHRTGIEWLAATIPDAELMVIEGAAHGVHTSDPAAFAALVDRAATRSAGG
jgi:pimeloyl-ACP methyl ester carboxylesterase